MLSHLNMYTFLIHSFAIIHSELTCKTVSILKSSPNHFDTYEEFSFVRCCNIARSNNDAPWICSLNCLWHYLSIMKAWAKQKGVWERERERVNFITLFPALECLYHNQTYIECSLISTPSSAATYSSHCNG